MSPSRDMIRRKTTSVDKFRLQLKNAKIRAQNSIHKMRDQTVVTTKHRPKLLIIDSEIKQLQKDVHELKKKSKVKPTDLENLGKRLDAYLPIITNCLKLMEEFQKRLKSCVSDHMLTIAEIEKLDKSIHEFYQETLLQLSELQEQEQTENKPFQFRNLATNEDQIRHDSNPQLKGAVRNTLVVSLFSSTTAKKPLRKKGRKEAKEDKKRKKG